MPLSPADLSRAHAAFGRADQIIEQRRALYAAIVEAVAGEPVPDADVLDNPAVRAHLGAVAGGRSRFDRSRLRPIADLVPPACDAAAAGHPVRLAASRSAPAELRDAVRRIGAELDAHNASVPTLALLTIDDQPKVERTLACLLGGTRLAVELAPQLATDLLPHIALFAVLRADHARRLGSASAREVPGLVVIPEPRSPLEVAEALVHEGAHQKFFDLAMTRAILGSTANAAPHFRPTWAPRDAPSWPLEQTFAAWHAYCCLSVLAPSLPGTEQGGLHSGSLLPAAAVRAEEIGAWLLEQGEHLGVDGHRLVRALLGHPPHGVSADEDMPFPAEDLAGAAESLVVRQCGERAVLARGTTPLQLYFVTSDVLGSIVGNRPC